MKLICLLGIHKYKFLNMKIGHMSEMMDRMVSTLYNINIPMVYKYKNVVNLEKKGYKMKHKHAKCYICGVESRYTTPVLGYTVCQPCHFKLVNIGQVTVKEMQRQKKARI